jgi:hypothetical protein
MKCEKRFVAIVSLLLAVFLSSASGTFNTGDGSLASLTFAEARTFVEAQTAKQQCMNVCQARYRACFSLKQIPSSECRGVYQDCTRFTCNALKG